MVVILTPIVLMVVGIPGNSRYCGAIRGDAFKHVFSPFSAQKIGGGKMSHVDENVSCHFVWAANKMTCSLRHHMR